MSDQYQWAEALRKARQNEQQKQPRLNFSAPSKISTEQLEEQMEYYKKKLLEAVQNKKTEEIQNLVERLINCHSRLTALLIKNEKDLGASDNSPLIAEYLQKYFSDSAKLLETFPT